MAKTVLAFAMAIVGLICTFHLRFSIVSGLSDASPFTCSRRVTAVCRCPPTFGDLIPATLTHLRHSFKPNGLGVALPPHVGCQLRTT
jgi:hypothetical protein